MVEYLQRLLAGEHSFVVNVTTDTGYWQRRGLVAVDAVGLVLDSEGAVCLPWRRVTRVTVDYT